MTVLVAKNTYRMSREKYLELLKIASDQVPFGVYAIEKGEYAELRCDRCVSMTQLKALIRGLRKEGYKVHSNGK